jgi:hypothetical protein
VIVLRDGLRWAERLTKSPSIRPLACSQTIAQYSRITCSAKIQSIPPEEVLAGKTRCPPSYAAAAALAMTTLQRSFLTPFLAGHAATAALAVGRGVRELLSFFLSADLERFGAASLRTFSSAAANGSKPLCLADDVAAERAGRCSHGGSLSGSSTPARNSSSAKAADDTPAAPPWRTRSRRRRAS